MNEIGAPGAARPSEVDVVVVGAGFAGMYLLIRLRELGFSTRVLEAGTDVGGTWYWNRYPGARCDIQSIDYSYSFDRELDETWVWSEKYAAQPEILRYARHVADRHDLRRDIDFGTRVERTVWDDGSRHWSVHTATGETIACRHYVMATGCLSVPKEIDIPGADRFAGPTHLTGRWPHEGVDFTGKRVAVIGTGSSGIQAIPLIAEQAAQLTVFQRTPNFSVPAGNGPIPVGKLAAFTADRAAYRQSQKVSYGGVPVDGPVVSALSVSAAEREAVYERAWELGGLQEFLGCFNDHLSNPAANELLAEFVRNKIRAIVRDPRTAESLCPNSYPIGTKRLCLDTNYFATFNRPNVRLVDLGRTPITTITETGVCLPDESIEFDTIVFATGFDAMTGAIVSVDITGRDGRTLAETWTTGPATYLGLMAAGFPNLFFITGPGSPSVLTNMLVSIEQHVDWIADCLATLRAEGSETIEPTETAVQGWVRHVNDFADLSLLPRANSWYIGANVPGKPRVFLPYPGGVARYRAICDDVVARDFLGFERRGAAGTRCVDGVVQPVAPDVQLMLEAIAGFQLPPMESMSVDEAREMSRAGEAVRPAGPDVGEVRDGYFPGAGAGAGAGGDLPYRLYRPEGHGPHPVVLYFHGGGWVLGNHTSDDPFCRDLCSRADVIVVSVGYRLAPEDRFPAAVDDAVAALGWIAAAAAALGGDPDRIAVAGWSAGANLAAVVSQWARDHDGPALRGQLLVTPVTDVSTTQPSMLANGDGFVLTKSLMDWFVDHYVHDADRHDARLSPLLAADLGGLPPAFIVTCEFDPLRDEGAAYAAALAAAGGAVRHLSCRGQIHTSLLAVGMLPSGAPYRAEMAAELRRWFATG